MICVSDLIACAHSQLVEDRQVEGRGGDHDKGVGEHEHAVLGAVHVHLGGRAQEGDGRHETGRLGRKRIG